MVGEWDEDQQRTTEEHSWQQRAPESTSGNQDSQGVRDNGEEEAQVDECSQKHRSRNEVQQPDHKGRACGL